MNRLKQIFTITLMFTSIITFGQSNNTELNERPYIEVTGTVETEIIPDEIYIGITIREKYVNKVKLTIEEQEEKLKSIVKTLAIDMKNLSLIDANANNVKVRWQKKDLLTKKEYILKVTNAKTVGQLFLELEKLEITEAFISKVNHSKMDSLKKEVKIQSIKVAKDKADYLLTAIGEQTGKPLVIKEIEYSFNPFRANVVNVNERRNESFGYFNEEVSSRDKEEDEIQIQKIKIRSSIYVKFSIK